MGFPHVQDAGEVDRFLCAGEGASSCCSQNLEPDAFSLQGGSLASRTDSLFERYHCALSLEHLGNEAV